MKNILQNLKNQFTNKYLDLFFEWNKKYDILNIAIIIFVMVFLSFFIGNHFYAIFSDKGREFLFPQEILNGKVPYKDITMIYFPLAYYINAGIYKILGVSINSLIISQTFLCTIFMIFYYFCAKIFLDKKISLLLTILVISCSIYSSNNELFSYIVPYAYAQTYGMISFFICMFSLIKLFKTDNLKYLYLASFMSGFCASCKLEFLSVYILLTFGLFLYKRLDKIQYCKVTILAFLVPLATILTIFIQGVSINDLINIIKFSIDFSQTSVMTKFLTSIGMYPDIAKVVNDMISFSSQLLSMTLLCFISLKLSKKYSKALLLIVPVLFWYYYNNYIALGNLWLFLPFLILVILLIKFKEILNNDKAFLILLIASLLISQREFFMLCLLNYGIFPFKFLILSFCILIIRYLPKEIYEVRVKSLLQYVLIIVIGLQLINIYAKYENTCFPINTSMGKFYVDNNNNNVLLYMLDYIENSVDKNSTVLVLPEGNIINFLSQRKVDMKCFMMDRLYHDAYGEEKATNAVVKTNSDYIILLEGFDNFNFYAPYLYDKNQTKLVKYIYDNYTVQKKTVYEYGRLIILKKNTDFTNQTLNNK